MNKSKLRFYADRISRRAGQAVADIGDSIAEHPWQAVIAALVVGFFVGVAA